MDNFSKRFIEQLGMLGEINDVSEDKLYLVFKPPNNKAVKLFYKVNSLQLVSYYVEKYNPLVMWSDPRGRFENLTEKEALQIIINYKEGLDWLEN